MIIRSGRSWGKDFAFRMLLREQVSNEIEYLLAERQATQTGITAIDRYGLVLPTRTGIPKDIFYGRTG